LSLDPWVKIHKSRPSSNLEKIRPDPKRGGSILLGYLNTRKCDEKTYFPTHILFCWRRQTPWHCTSQARACRFRERFRCCFHVTCSVLSAPAMSSAYNPRCSHQCSRLPQLGISRRSRAQSSRQTSWNRSAKRALASPPFVAARPPATCAPMETAACDEQPGRETCERLLACQWIRAPRPSLTARRATCTSGQAARPRARSFPMRSSRPAGPSALTTRQLPAWQHAANWRAGPILHLVGDSRARCSPAARHGLEIRHELGNDAASGRIGRH